MPVILNEIIDAKYILFHDLHLKCPQLKDMLIPGPRQDTVDGSHKFKVEISTSLLVLVVSMLW